MKKCPRLTEAQKAELTDHIVSHSDAKEVKRAQAVLLTLILPIPPSVC